MYTELEIEAILFGALVPTDNDRDMIAVGLDERFCELGGDHPMPYTDDDGERWAGGIPLCRSISRAIRAREPHHVNQIT